MITTILHWLSPSTAAEHLWPLGVLLLLLMLSSLIFLTGRAIKDPAETGQMLLRFGNALMARFESAEDEPVQAAPAAQPAPQAQPQPPKPPTSPKSGGKAPAAKPAPKLGENTSEIPLVVGKELPRRTHHHDQLADPDLADLPEDEEVPELDFPAKPEAGGILEFWKRLLQRIPRLIHGDEEEEDPEFRELNRQLHTTLEWPRPNLNPEEQRDKIRAVG